MESHQESETLRASKPCDTITNYEDSAFVVLNYQNKKREWKGLQLGDKIASMENLSELQTKYVQELKIQIEKRFPERRWGMTFHLKLILFCRLIFIK